MSISSSTLTALRRKPELSRELLPSYDPRKMVEATDALLAQTRNPHHRAIIHNYRRHGLLEVSGRWQEILVPEMTIAEPIYRLVTKAGVLVLDGMKAVSDFYRAGAERGRTVFGPLVENLAVADWGLTQESLFYVPMSGQELLAQGERVDDPQGWYALTVWLAGIWPYDEHAKLIGEMIYEDISSRRIHRIDPSTITTTQQAAAMLAPYLDNPPP